jgi:hypothetical protein
MTDTVPVEPGGMPPKSCPSGYYYDSTLNNCMVNQSSQEDLYAALEKLPAAIQQLAVGGFGSLALVVQCGADVQLQQLAAALVPALTAFTKKYGDKPPAWPTELSEAYAAVAVKWKGKITTCADLKAAVADFTVFCNNVTGESAGGGMGLPLIAGAAALALLLFRR